MIHLRRLWLSPEQLTQMQKIVRKLSDEKAPISIVIKQQKPKRRIYRIYSCRLTVNQERNGNVQ